MSDRNCGVKPKFQRGDIVFVGRKYRYGAATFTITHREYDRRFRTWFYRDENGPQYEQDLLTLAAPKVSKP